MTLIFMVSVYKSKRCTNCYVFSYVSSKNWSLHSLLMIYHLHKSLLIEKWY